MRHDLEHSSKAHVREKNGKSLCGCRGDDRLLFSVEMAQDLLQKSQSAVCKKCRIKMEELAK